MVSSVKSHYTKSIVALRLEGFKLEEERQWRILTA